MSSDRRHSSNIPEIEEHSDDMAALLKKHGNNILLVIILIVLLLVSWTWLKNSKRIKEVERQQALAKVLVSRDQSQFKSLSSTDDSLAGDTAYQPVAEINQLGELAAKEAGTSIGSNAMIQQAVTIISQLYIGKEYITADKKAEICKDASAIYDSVISKYSSNATAVCQAKLGLAAIACEMKEWDKASELYNSILAKEDVLSSTVFPAMAQAGLDRIEDLKGIEDIEFPPAPEPEMKAEEQENTAEDLAGIGSEETEENVVGPEESPAPEDTEATE